MTAPPAGTSREDRAHVTRVVILVVVAVVITLAVYGVVALIVKMDDIGLSMAQRDSATSRRIGRGLVAGMPRLLTALSVIGTAAMLWVGGHILLVGADELGWHRPYDLVHDAERQVHDAGAIGGALEWLVNTGISAIVGLAVGLLVTAVVAQVQIRRSPDVSTAGH